MTLQTCSNMYCPQLVARGPAIGKKFHAYNEKDGLTSVIGRNTVPHESGKCFYHTNFKDEQSLKGKGGNHRVIPKRKPFTIKGL